MCPTSSITPYANVTSAVGELMATEDFMTLQASGHTSLDPDSGESSTLTYSWTTTRLDGTTLAPSSTVTATARYQPAQGGTYTVRVNVRDTHNAPSGITASLEVYVNYRPTSFVQTPGFTALVGETMATEGLSTITLMGSGVDVEDHLPLLYTWNVTNSIGSVLSNTTTPSPTFKPQIGGTHGIRLTVKDSMLAPAPNTAYTSYRVNWRPTSTIQPYTVSSSTYGETEITANLTTINLVNGSADTDTDQTMTYYWRVRDVSNTVRDAEVTSPYAYNTTFKPLQFNTYTVQMVVSDSKLAPSPTTAVQTIRVTNRRPTATINDWTVVASDGETYPTTDSVKVNFHSGSLDADGNALSYVWTVTNTGGTPQVLRNGTFTADPEFTYPPVATTYTVQLFVTDTKKAPGVSTPTRQFYVTERPRAVITHSPASPGTGQLVTLTGSASADPDGTVASYQWTLYGTCQRL